MESTVKASTNPQKLNTFFLNAQHILMFFWYVRVARSAMECDNYVVIYVNCFKSRLDTFWQNQDIVYFRAEIEGTGNRSEV